MRKDLLVLGYYHQSHGKQERTAELLKIVQFILETYIAPLQDTATQRRFQSSHGQGRKT